MKHKSTVFRILIVLVVLSMALTACGGDDKDEKKSYTVGLYYIPGSAEAAIAGLKAGLTERGYVEGDNITYLMETYAGGDGAEEIAAVFQSFVEADVDLILTSNADFAVVAQQVTAGTDIPLVIGMCGDPVAYGLVESMEQPGKNTTGLICQIGSFETEGRRLEFLLQADPTIKRILIPVNPDDASMVANYNIVVEAAEQLGVEVVSLEYRSSEEFRAALADAPDDIDAWFGTSGGFQGENIPTIVAFFTERQIPDTGVSPTYLSVGSLMSYGPEFYSASQQVWARLVDQVLQGADAGTLPMEWHENVLGINLVEAEAIGLEIPEDLLEQAAVIYRGEETE